MDGQAFMVLVCRVQASMGPPMSIGGNYSHHEISFRWISRFVTLYPIEAKGGS